MTGRRGAGCPFAGARNFDGTWAGRFLTIMRALSVLPWRRIITRTRDIQACSGHSKTMHFDTYSDFIPLIMIALTIWVMRARFSSPIDTPWPLLYYLGLVLFVRSNEGEVNNYWIFVDVASALFLRYEFMAGVFLKAFRTGEFAVHLYVIVGCFLMLTRTG